MPLRLAAARRALLVRSSCLLTTYPSYNRLITHPNIHYIRHFLNFITSPCHSKTRQLTAFLLPSRSCPDFGLNCLALARALVPFSIPSLSYLPHASILPPAVSPESLQILCTRTLVFLGSRDPPMLVSRTWPRTRNAIFGWATFLSLNRPFHLTQPLLRTRLPGLSSSLQTRNVGLAGSIPRRAQRLAYISPFNGATRPIATTPDAPRTAPVETSLSEARSQDARQPLLPPFCTATSPVRLPLHSRHLHTIQPI